ncbi:AAEL003031-PA [Aedes aegypti]|uniref:AAEL003031-PA n=1 Tax=Aedes aegypti TaxID=7159 RepID=Q17BJ0_AEDAE|nr:AAEL013988-PA [Aedes aegypti]EAT42644.1 AAEL005860-PA [Aedes aegypti]EAT43620.1 AAEL004963-PA [Aedes aegypti]EAT44600.1 AAEL004072-PA [Aedes aegypti]EAT45725.1 AAEL003031-PA [Aedes aegypti]
MVFGDYPAAPAEYNSKIHGPYDPARYYGKPDTPLDQVKLNEFGAWFGRRDKNPAAAEAVSRAFWRWQPKRRGIVPFFQVIGKLKHHRNYKYH